MVGGKIYYSLSQQFAIVKLFQKMTWEVGVELNALFSCLLNELKLKILYLDMSETSYVDSTILGTLVHLNKNTDSINVKTVICSPSKQCEMVLIDVGLHKVLKIDNGPPPKMELASELVLVLKKRFRK
jgi:anti-anti-sigma factor